jgi:hypothetical protein
MDENDPITTAHDTWQHLQHQADTARAAFFDLCAQRVSEGADTADTIAARSSPTAVTIRKELRARGVEPLPRGPKRKTAPAGEPE